MVRGCDNVVVCSHRKIAFLGYGVVVQLSVDAPLLFGLVQHIYCVIAHSGHVRGLGANAEGGPPLLVALAALPSAGLTVQSVDLLFDFLAREEVFHVPQHYAQTHILAFVEMIAHRLHRNKVVRGHMARTVRALGLLVYYCAGLREELIGDGVGAA